MKIHCLQWDIGSKNFVIGYILKSFRCLNGGFGDIA